MRAAPGVGLGLAGLGLIWLWLAGLAGAGWLAAFVALALILTGAAVLGSVVLRRALDRAEELRMFRLTAADHAACFLADSAGHLLLRNTSAEDRFGTDAASVLAVLGRHVLAPGPFLLRLQTLADRDGAARQDIALSSGRLRLSVHRAGADRFFWRLDEIADSDSTAFADPVAGRADQTATTDLEDVPVALMTFGPDGVLRSANRAARDLMMQGELRSVLFHDLFDGLGRPVADWLADVAAGRIPGGTEVLRARRGGEEDFLQVTLHRFMDGKRVSVLAVLQDATRLKTLEAQFAQSQKMQAIGQLAGGIAHDFNNLLTAISGHCDLLLLRHGRDAPDFADLEQIRQNSNRAAALVGQLLAFSRKQTLKAERLDLEEVLSDLTHLLNRLVVERVGLRLAHLGQGLGRPLRPVRADRRQLEQVLVNLVVNARDAMPNGGGIVVETEPVTLTEPLKRDRASVPAGDYSVIRVIDQGVGIAEENLQKIFEPFFTTKGVGEGTGLGLSMAYGIVKQSGGYIFVDSELGKGTVFTLFFPAYEGEIASASPALDTRRISGKVGTGVVLLVEDEAPVRAFAGRALRLRGHTVLEAEHGEAALALLDDKALEIDVVVTDVVMPGLDGPSWVREALKTRPNLRVIFVSGYAEDCLSEDQARIPNSIFLPKPFSLNDLTGTVQGQLRG